MILRQTITRRRALRVGGSIAAIAAVSVPSILLAQGRTLKITTWGGKWGDIMKATVLPAFEKENRRIRHLHQSEINLYLQQVQSNVSHERAS